MKTEIQNEILFTVTDCDPVKVDLAALEPIQLSNLLKHIFTKAGQRLLNDGVGNKSLGKVERLGKAKARLSSILSGAARVSSGTSPMIRYGLKWAVNWAVDVGLTTVTKGAGEYRENPDKFLLDLTRCVLAKQKGIPRANVSSKEIEKSLESVNARIAKFVAADIKRDEENKIGSLELSI